MENGKVLKTGEDHKGRVAGAFRFSVRGQMRRCRGR